MPPVGRRSAAGTAGAEDFAGDFGGFLEAQWAEGRHGGVLLETAKRNLRVCFSLRAIG